MEKEEMDMGGVVEGIFGGSSKSPSTPDYEPVPVREEESEPESKAVREAEQRKLKARRGMSGTLLTSPLGTSGGSGGGSGSSAGSGLLGRTV